MPDDDVNLKLGMLLERTSAISVSVEKIDAVTDIIRSDQTSMRREIDFMKDLSKQTKEKADALLPTVTEHGRQLALIMPLLPSMQEVDTGLKRSKKAVGLVGIIAVSPYAPGIWGWLKTLLHWPWLGTHT